MISPFHPSAGDKSVIPADAEPIGRIVVGLYGNHVPITVSNFLETVKAGAYTGTTFSRLLPGQYIQAGRQGSRRMGEVLAPEALQANPELSRPESFRLTHSRPGTLSLSLGENDENPTVKERSGYRNTEFLITTGPGPVPRLDSLNIPFGRVVNGLDVVAQVVKVPSFQPTENAVQLNSLASKIGDDRAAGVRRKYGKPLKAVVITQLGLLDE